MEQKYNAFGTATNKLCIGTALASELEVNNSARSFILRAASASIALGIAKVWTVVPLSDLFEYSSQWIFTVDRLSSILT